MALSPERIYGDLLDIYRKVEAGERLSYEDGLRLYRTPNLTAVGQMANLVRERRHGAKTYFVRNQHINYTNICNKFCKFCSFYAKKGGPAPYQMSIEQVRERLEWHRDANLTEVHMVGGINPRLPYQYYMDLVRTVKETLPGVHVKAFTAVEIVEIARQGKVTMQQALADLIEAGLDSLPGGGIEILSDRVHAELFGKKLNGEEWKDVARAAAKLGLKQYATMLYGHIETDEERTDHLVQLAGTAGRDRQLPHHDPSQLPPRGHRARAHSQAHRRHRLAQHRGQPADARQLRPHQELLDHEHRARHPDGALVRRGRRRRHRPRVRDHLQGRRVWQQEPGFDPGQHDQDDRGSPPHPGRTRFAVQRDRARGAGEAGSAIDRDSRCELANHCLQWRYAKANFRS